MAPMLSKATPFLMETKRMAGVLVRKKALLRTYVVACRSLPRPCGVNWRWFAEGIFFKRRISTWYVDVENERQTKTDGRLQHRSELRIYVTRVSSRPSESLSLLRCIGNSRHVGEMASNARRHSVERQLTAINGLLRLSGAWGMLQRGAVGLAVDTYAVLFLILLLQKGL